MKKLLYAYVLILSSYSFGQIPKYTSNAIDLDLSTSSVYSEFQNGYEVIFSHNLSSYWQKRENYQILVFDEGTWKIINWSHKRINPNNPKIRRKRKKVRAIDSKKVNEFLELVDSVKFFHLHNDSLNWNEKYLNDGSVLKTSVLDGHTHEFQIISQYGFFTLQASNPERLQEFIAVEQRKIFLKIENEFLDLFADISD